MTGGRLAVGTALSRRRGRHETALCLKRPGTPGGPFLCRGIAASPGAGLCGKGPEVAGRGATGGCVCLRCVFLRAEPARRPGFPRRFSFMSMRQGPCADRLRRLRRFSAIRPEGRKRGSRNGGKAALLRKRRGGKRPRRETFFCGRKGGSRACSPLRPGVPQRGTEGPRVEPAADEKRLPEEVPTGAFFPARGAAMRSPCLFSEKFEGMAGSGVGLGLVPGEHGQPDGQGEEEHR